MGKQCSAHHVSVGACRMQKSRGKGIYEQPNVGAEKDLRSARAGCALSR